MWVNRAEDFDATGFVGDYMADIKRLRLMDGVFHLEGSNDWQTVRNALNAAFLQNPSGRPVTTGEYVITTKARGGKTSIREFVIVEAKSLDTE